MKWRVVRWQQAGWSVTSPSGRRTWTAAPSQAAALNLAQSLVGIEAMLGSLAVRATS